MALDTNNAKRKNRLLRRGMLYFFTLRKRLADMVFKEKVLHSLQVGWETSAEGRRL